MSIPHKFSSDYAHKKPATKRVAEMVTEPDNVPGDANALAARVIARYNVERREAGEKPLDLDGIGRMRQLLAEVIERPGPAKDTDAH